MVAAVVATFALLILAGGCGNPVEGPALVLSLASPDTSTDVNAPHVKRFADEVARLSKGTIRLDPAWDVAPAGIHGWDQQVAGQVADGTYDLGLVPGRAWDELGVTSLRALDAPFLVTSTALLEQVLNSELREELLSGLPEAGVVGVDLFPERLRHPVGFERPLIGVADYRGQVIRAPRSATTWQVLQAFGGRPGGRRRPERCYPTGDGELLRDQRNRNRDRERGAVSQDRDARHQRRGSDRMREDQWQLLQRAAANTRTWLFEELPTEAEAAAEFCAAGGRIVAASPSDLDDLREAANPVTQALSEHPHTGRIIEAIESLGRRHPEPEVVDRCPTAAGEAEPTAPTDVELHELDGVYATRVTQRQLRDAGVTDEGRVLENAARYRWILDGGRWTYHARAAHFLISPTDTGQYTYKNGLFTLDWGDGGWTSFRPVVAGNGTLTMHDIRDSDPALQPETEGLFGSPWIRLSDLSR